MNKHNSVSILNILFLLAIVLSSGCGQSIVPNSTILTLIPSQTPFEAVTPTNTATTIPKPIITPELIRPKGTIIFSNFSGIYALNIETQEMKTLFESNNSLYTNTFVNEYLYFLHTTENKDKLRSGFGPSKIFRSSLDGNNLTQLTFDEHNDFGFSISSDNKYLAYSTVQGIEQYQLIVLDLIKNKLIAKVYDSEAELLFPSWSPDGSKLFFLENTVPGSSGQLYIYTLKGNKLKRVLPEIAIRITKPSWSPDGNYIMLTANVNGQEHIYKFNTENEQFTDLAFNDDAPENFVWSPNGRWVLFEQESLSGTTKLLLLDVTTNKTTVVQEGSVNGMRQSYLAIWSPDSKYFAHFLNPRNNLWNINIQEIATGKKLEFKMPASSINSVTWINSQ
jgi:Tol biopolymer transport system component